MFGFNVGFSDTSSKSRSSTGSTGNQSGFTTFNPYATGTLQSLGNAYGQSGQAYLSSLQGLSSVANSDPSNQTNLKNALESSANVGQPQFLENLSAVRSRGYGGGNALDLKMQNQMLQDYQNQRQANLDQMVLHNQQNQEANKLNASQQLGALSGQGIDYLRTLANQTQQYNQSQNTTGTEHGKTIGVGGGVGI